MKEKNENDPGQGCFWGDILLEKTIEQLIYEETEERLRQMQAPEYRFPEQANWKDGVGILLLIGVSTLLVVLCMMGVIA